MSRIEALEQYNSALSAGKKYYKSAVSRGEYPYPLILDDILDESAAAGSVSIGLINIPSELIVGTKGYGRSQALAGNFMPLLGAETEFGSKWISLCEAHLSSEGIRDPIKCFEYMGKFYVEEGNKRASVLLSYGSPTVPGAVTRIIPQYSDDEQIKIYYEFMHFYQLSGTYLVNFNHRGGFAKLQAALGMDEDHVWTEDERRSFSAGFSMFRSAFDKLNTDKINTTPAEALLVWLKVFSFSDIKNLSSGDMLKQLGSLWPDVRSSADSELIEVSTEPDDRGKSIISRIIGFAIPDRLNIAFIYGFDPEGSAWTRSHEHGREYIEQIFGEKITVKTYLCPGKDYYGTMEAAIEDGAQLIFATTPPMIDACRRIAALHSDVKVMNCALSQPYTGVRMYYSRIYECKYITGIIAGAMAEEDEIGYIASYPIFGTPAGINAFALGVRATNPRAVVRLQWSCVPGDPLSEFINSGISVISNRDATNPINSHWALEWGTYKYRDGELLPLAVPCWNWGKMYERIIKGIFNGQWSDTHSDKAINYWWGMDSGVIDIQLSDKIPDGVKSLAENLKAGIISGSIEPFRTRIFDNSGTLRNPGEASLAPDEIMTMDWLADNIDGRIPDFEEIAEQSKELVRELGIYRNLIPPEKEEEVQL